MLHYYTFSFSFLIVMKLQVWLLANILSAIIKWLAKLLAK